MNPPAVKLLLDTSYCLHLIRERQHVRPADFDAYTPGEIAVSSITVAALADYAQASSQPEQNRRALEMFLLPLVVVDFDAEAARLLAQAGAQGQVSSDVHSALLAAHARRLNAVLVTRRPDLYVDIRGVRIRTEVNSEIGSVAAIQGGAAGSALRLRQPAAGPHTIVLTGSHDLSLDVLADELHGAHPSLVLAAAHVGSVTGLLSLREHAAHLAGAHLLDPATGEFNVSHVRRLLASHGVHVVLVGFVSRVQGLIVAHGNPKGITSLEDLVRQDVVLINRQPGSGTRVLLDFHLQQGQLNPAQIQGYASAASTHLAVAGAVAQGSADCGLGIQAAAQALGLDFVPLFGERYDLVIPTEYYESALLAPLLALLRQPSPALRQRIAALGGYDTTPMGKVLAEI